MLQTFLPLFLMTFGICLFIVLMQFLWRYIDDMVGKGLGIPDFRYFKYHCCFVCPASLVVVFIGGFRLFFFLDDPGDLRTKRKGKEGMVSDESETEKGI